MNLRELAKIMAGKVNAETNRELVDALAQWALECRRSGYTPSLDDLGQSVEEFAAWKLAGALYELEQARRFAWAASEDPVTRAQAQADLDGGQSAIDALTQAVADSAARDEMERR